MRMSCNGCRALRRGCSMDCPLKPCLQWIKSPESQANATVFLAKFYGRAGLLNLINAASPHLRPEIFRSLLHEACGRIINPVHGSVGLMWSGDWQRCQEVVAAVLEGAPIKIEAHVSDSGDHEEYSSIIPSLRGSHHLSREAVSGQHRGKTPRRLKRSRPSQADDYYSFMSEPQEKFTITGWEEYCNDDDEEELKICRAPSHDDSLSVGDIRPGRVVKPEPGFTGLDLTLGPN